MVIDGAGAVLMVHAAGGSIPVALRSTAKVTDLVTGEQLCASCNSFTLNLSGAETHVLHIKHCGIPDAATLVACGFTGAHYGNALIVPYGQLTLTYSGECSCL